MRVRRTTPGRATSRRTRRVLGAWWMVLVVAVGSALAGSCSRGGGAEGSIVADAVPGSFEVLAELPDGARQVTVGLYGVNAYDLDVTSNTFYFSGYMWVRWSGDEDPTASLEFANSVQDWDFTQLALSEEPMELDSGEKLMQYRIQGRFFEPLELGDYPLDHQQLSILLEDSMLTGDDLVLVPDREQSGLDSGLKIPGWHLAGLSMDTLLHDYGTSFGDPSGEAAPYATLRFALELDRSGNLFVWKLMLPLVLVMATNWLALVLHPRFVEVRTAMPATALLTTVFLQQSSMAGLPEVSELVLMDLMYVLAYGLIVFTFGHIVIDNLRLREEEAGEIQSVLRWDRISLAVQVAVAVAAVPVVLLLR